MTNKYLEKIAASAIGSGLRAVGSVAKDAVSGLAKDVGSSASKAFGSGFANKAHELGVTNQRKLRNVKDTRSFMRATKGMGVPHSEIKDLQKDKNKAIVKSTLYAGGAVYGGNKLLNKIKQRNEYQYYQ